MSFFSSSRQRAFQFGLFGLVSMAISFILRQGFEHDDDWRSRASYKHQLKSNLSYPMITLTEYNTSGPVRAPHIILSSPNNRYFDL